MKVAVVGCGHGTLDEIYTELPSNLHLIIICGDFQAVRNAQDLQSLSCPPKYRVMNSFWKYYQGQVQPPCPTLIIGGNHEASNHMHELPYGGWVAPMIYYMGYAGVVQFGPLRIAGISGIYKKHDYFQPHFETPPYDAHTLKSVYHVRQFDAMRLMKVKGDIDIMLSHDWPQNVAKFGDLKSLLKYKPFLANDVSI